jgi:nucleoside-diphosphate-sugar epimerase
VAAAVAAAAGTLPDGIPLRTHTARHFWDCRVYIDNLVSAHLLALANLMSPQPTAHLEAFCISDDHPVNQFEFLAPLLVAVGGTRLTWFIPTAMMLYVAFVLEWLYSFPSCQRIFNVIPLLTRAEVNKVGVTHYFEMTKARRLLNYSVLVPHPVGMERTAARWAGWFKAEQQRHPPAGSMGGVLWVLAIGVAACLAFARWLCI